MSGSAINSFNNGIQGAGAGANQNAGSGSFSQSIANIFASAKQNKQGQQGDQKMVKLEMPADRAKKVESYLESFYGSGKSGLNYVG